MSEKLLSIIGAPPRARWLGWVTMRYTESVGAPSATQLCAFVFCNLRYSDRKCPIFVVVWFVVVVVWLCAAYYDLLVFLVVWLWFVVCGCRAQRQFLKSPQPWLY